jgi:hypothetical protein
MVLLSRGSTICTAKVDTTVKSMRTAVFCVVWWVGTDVSEKCAASVFRTGTHLANCVAAPHSGCQPSRLPVAQFNRICRASEEDVLQPDDGGISM